MLSGNSSVPTRPCYLELVNKMRAFDAATITGDSGFGLSFQPEYTVPFDFGADGLPKGWSVTPFLLGDYGKVYNARVKGLPNGELVSAGGGFRLGISCLVLILEADKPINRTPLYKDNRDPRFFVGLEFGLSQALTLAGINP